MGPRAGISSPPFSCSMPSAAHTKQRTALVALVVGDMSCSEHAPFRLVTLSLEAHERLELGIIAESTAVPEDRYCVAWLRGVHGGVPAGLGEHQRCALAATAACAALQADAGWLDVCFDGGHGICVAVCGWRTGCRGASNPVLPPSASAASCRRRRATHRRPALLPASLPHARPPIRCAVICRWHPTMRWCSPAVGSRVEFTRGCMRVPRRIQCHLTHHPHGSACSSGTTWPRW